MSRWAPAGVAGRDYYCGTCIGRLEVVCEFCVEGRGPGDTVCQECEGAGVVRCPQCRAGEVPVTPPIW
jgi:hypothetical protein